MESLLPSIQFFIVFLVVGLILVGAEIFVPGGILGVLGGLSLFGAMITGFIAFPGKGLYIAAGILFLIGIVIAMWVKYFPKTSIGKSMTVSRELTDAKGTDKSLDELLNTTGEALSHLRPSGFATINGRKVDVISSGEMISKGDKIKVIDVESNRVIVKKIEQQN